MDSLVLAEVQHGRRARAGPALGCSHGQRHESGQDRAWQHLQLGPDRGLASSHGHQAEEGQETVLGHSLGSIEVAAVVTWLWVPVQGQAWQPSKVRVEGLAHRCGNRWPPGYFRVT